MFGKITKSLLAIAFILSAYSANAANCSDPKLFVESVRDESIAIIDSKGSDDEKATKLDAMFRNTADTDWMSKFVYGRSYSTLTPEQQKEYAKVYADYLSTAYVGKFKEYNGEKITINQVKPVNNDFVVDTTIERADKPAVTVTYRVKKEGACFKVSDIIAEGVSLINTQRQEFNSVINAKGYDGLIEALKAKIAKQQ